MNIIEAKNISKKYKINHQQGGYVALRDILTNVFRHPFIFLKEKTKSIIGLQKKEVFWALKDINFEIMKGEVVGIIGHNGAGKSTLLKILSRITPPTTGEIKIHGTVGSLLEVGTGFHPELTGRENIFLNGAILGMRKTEIISKFDEIVAFADIEKFIDTPVKHYSSGMYVRLAFSVAAHMDPDILIIDEVLAVGDTEFQKKCLGKMEDITKKEGRTILFVSHNTEAIRALCDKTILLEQGSIRAIGPTEEVLRLYHKQNAEVEETQIPTILSQNNKNAEVLFRKIWATKDGTTTNIIEHNIQFTITTELETTKDLGQIELTLSIKNSSGVTITSTSLSDESEGKLYSFKKGIYTTKATIPANFLIPDVYTIRIYAHEKGIRDIAIYEDALRIKIIDNGSSMKSYGSSSTKWACVFSNAKWNIEKN